MNLDTNHTRLFSGQSLLLLVGGVLTNLLGAQVALRFGWPVFLDSIGTIITAALGGSLPGVLVGFLSNYINSASDPITMYYGIISVLFGFMAAFFSRRGAFKSLWRCLLTALPFTVVGGGGGSVLTWLLYGFDFGVGISAGLANTLYQRFALSKFWAQFAADISIDLLDKLVTLLLVFLILRFLPNRLTAKLPLGDIYQRGPQPAAPAQNETTEIALHPKTSLRDKVVRLIIGTAVIISAIAISISFIIYKDTMLARYDEYCTSATSLMLLALDAESIDTYLETQTVTPEYQRTKQQLAAIKSSMPDVEYMYVYQIREDGCHVVFDVDTPETPGAQLGEIIPHEEPFAPLLPALLAGETIDPVISNGAYGWLLTVYQPVYAQDGRCVAYAAADIEMRAVIADRYVFVIKIVALLFGATILITAFALWYAETRFVTPINAMTVSASRFAYDSLFMRTENIRQLQSLNIRTGDEIESLYNAISKTFAEVDQYISLLDEKSASIAEKAELISRMQNNVILSFASMVESRDENTGGHIRRTAGYVRAIGEALMESGPYSRFISPERLDNLARSAPLHDIGKITIPDAILNKPGRLTPAEFEIIKSHTTAGRDILRRALTGIEGENYLSEAADMTAHHHERWDGTGYPDGLAGEDIPLCARMMAVADVFDALISKRSYKDAMPFDDAVHLIQSEAGEHFDPVVVEAFRNVLPQIRTLSQHNEDA